jgi:microcystin-dependent protein
MASITTRAGKGTPLTHTEVDDNFTNLNAAKLEASNNLSDVSSASAARTNLGLATVASTGAYSDLTGTPAAYTDSDVDTHLNTGTAVTGEYLSWNGTDYDWAAVPAGYADADVDTHLNTGTAVTGEYLSWNGTDYDWAAVPAGYADSDVDTHLNTGTATTGQVLTWTGTDYDWAEATGDGTPAGTIIYFAGSTPPPRHLKANGAAVSRTSYADLFAAIGTTWGAGDGSTTFGLPDGRGEFPRGWDDARGVDSGRSFGSAQADELKSHQHMQSMRSEAAISDTPWGTQVDSASVFGRYAYSNTGAGDFPLVSPTGGSETRPRNIALLACIKY